MRRWAVTIDNSIFCIAVAIGLARVSASTPAAAEDLVMHLDVSARGVTVSAQYATFPVDPLGVGSGTVAPTAVRKVELCCS